MVDDGSIEEGKWRIEMGEYTKERIESGEWLVYYKVVEKDGRKSKIDEVWVDRRLMEGRKREKVRNFLKRRVKEELRTTGVLVYELMVGVRVDDMLEMYDEWINGGRKNIMNFWEEWMDRWKYL